MNRNTLNQIIKNESIADIPLIYVIRIILAVMEVDDV